MEISRDTENVEYCVCEIDKEGWPRAAINSCITMDRFINRKIAAKAALMWSNPEYTDRKYAVFSLRREQ